MRSPRRVPARLVWLRLSEDGSAPRPQKFTVPAKFDHQGDEWRANSWSLVVEQSAAADADEPQEVEVYFLVHDAPVDWLTSGRGFVLYDGLEPIAEGTIL